jgi:hypothetical protein
MGVGELSLHLIEAVAQCVGAGPFLSGRSFGPVPSGRGVGQQPDCFVSERDRFVSPLLSGAAITGGGGQAMFSLRCPLFSLFGPMFGLFRPLFGTVRPMFGLFGTIFPGCQEIGQPIVLRVLCGLRSGERSSARAPDCAGERGRGCNSVSSGTSTRVRPSLPGCMRQPSRCARILMASADTPNRSPAAAYVSQTNRTPGQSVRAKFGRTCARMCD